MSSITREQLEHWDKHCVWHAFTQMAEYEPWLVDQGEGCELVDVDGRRYLDGVSSLWCNVHGHRHPKLNDAIRQQLDQVAHVTSLGMSNPTTVELAGRLAQISPAGLQHVFFSSDGSSAVEVALKMAFQYWQQRDDPRPQKTKYIALDDAYHGDTIGSVSVGGVARFHEMFRPLLFDVVRLPTPQCYRTPAGVAADQLTQHYAAQLHRVLEQHQDEIAAVVIEPLMQCAAGMITHPPGFLSEVRRLTQTYDVLLIADEVAVGFGRTGRLFACQQEDVAPDLLCLGKGLTGGYLPMAATLATTEIWNAFQGAYADSKTFFHGHTYGGNPLAAAVALASLDVFEEEQVLEQLGPKIDRLSQHLQRMSAMDGVGDTRQCGLIAGIELVEDKQQQTPFAWQEQRGIRACKGALERGVWLRPLGNVVVIMPPLSVTLQQLDQICEAAEHGIRQAVSNSQ